jgi:Sec-independent protein secretion pathway component TatC
MYSLDTTFISQQYYHIQKDLYVKGFGYALGVVGFLELLRSQVCEMNVLQLVPGFYLILLFTSFLVLVNLSNLLLSISYQVDIRKAGGAKTLNRIQVLVLVKFGFLIVFTGMLIAFNTLIPLGFDSFDSYGETTLENVWSFAEIISVETTLIFFLVILSQIPVVAILNFEVEEDALQLPQVWKPLSLSCFVISGIITPTVDAYTQLSFAGAALALYVMVITIIQKRVNLKFVETATLG